MVLQQVNTTGDGSCGYRSIDPDDGNTNSRAMDQKSRTWAINLVLRHIGEKHVRELIAPEIENLFNNFSLPQAQLGQLGDLRKQINDLEASTMSPQMADAERHRIRQQITTLTATIKSECEKEEVIRTYLEYLKGRHTWSELPGTSYDGGDPSGGLGSTNLLDAIAYILRKNLVIVSLKHDGGCNRSGIILHRYDFDAEHNTEGTIYIFHNGMNHFSKAKVTGRL